MARMKVKMAKIAVSVVLIMVAVASLLAGQYGDMTGTMPNWYVRQNGYSLPGMKWWGRVGVHTNTGGGFAEIERFYRDVKQDQFLAQLQGVNWVQLEADERLALIFEAFRWKDEEFYRLVMTSYGAELRPRPNQ